MKYYSIGEFSSITGFSVKALRLYEKKGLLKPAYTDSDSRYRYYTSLNLIDSNMIKELKSLGLPLAEIGQYLSERDKEKLFDLYKSKRKEIAEEIKNLRNLESLLDLRINSGCLEKSDEIIPKFINERYIISERKKMSCRPESLSKEYYRLFEYLREKKLGYLNYMAVFHDEPQNFNPESADIEIAAEISDAHEHADKFRIMESGLYLTFVFKGSYAEIISGYEKIMKYADQNCFAKNGPAVEIYHRDFTTEKKEENFVTELQVPVRKK